MIRGFANPGSLETMNQRHKIFLAWLKRRTCFPFEESETNTIQLSSHVIEFLADDFMACHLLSKCNIGLFLQFFQAYHR